jgi:hypothetical protein
VRIRAFDLEMFVINPAAALVQLFAAPDVVLRGVSVHGKV